MLVALVAVATAAVTGMAEEEEAHKQPTESQHTPHTHSHHVLPIHPQHTSPTDSQHTLTPIMPRPHPGHQHEGRDCRQQLTEEEEQLMTKENRRHKQQLTGMKQKREEQVVRERQRQRRRKRNKEGEEEEERQKREMSRLFISEESDSLVIGNPAMFLLGLFALAVGGIALASQFLPGTPITRRVDYT